MEFLNIDSPNDKLFKYDHRWQIFKILKDVAWIDQRPHMWRSVKLNKKVIKFRNRIKLFYRLSGWNPNPISKFFSLTHLYKYNSDFFNLNLRTSTRSPDICVLLGSPNKNVRLLLIYPRVDKSLSWNTLF
jgi:hypothetical protein